MLEYPIHPVDCTYPNTFLDGLRSAVRQAGCDGKTTTVLFTVSIRNAVLGMESLTACGLAACTMKEIKYFLFRLRWIFVFVLLCCLNSIHSWRLVMVAIWSLAKTFYSTLGLFDHVKSDLCLTLKCDFHKCFICFIGFPAKDHPDVEQTLLLETVIAKRIIIWFLESSQAADRNEQKAVYVLLLFTKLSKLLFSS